MTAVVETTTDVATHRSQGDRWIRWTTTASVILLAAIAAVVSYRHMHTLTLAHGESTWTPALLPLSVDGMIIASSMTLLADSRAGQSSSGLPWALLATGSAASLAANVAVAEPTLYGRVIAAWPSVALIGAYELLMRQIRNAATEQAESADVWLSLDEPGREPGLPHGAELSAVEQSRAVGTTDRTALSSDLVARARQIDAAHWAQHGRPASAETIRVQLKVGARCARALKDSVRSQTSPIAA